MVRFIGKQEAPLKVFPEDHHATLAKMIHESYVKPIIVYFRADSSGSSSDKSLAELIKSLRSILVPTVSQASIDDEEAAKPVNVLPPAVLKKAVLEIADRVNYGIESPSTIDVELDDDDDEIKMPNGLCIWRWEVTDREDVLCTGFGQDLIDKIEKRFDERQKVREQAVALVKALDDDARRVLFDKSKKAAKGKGKATAGGSDNDMDVDDKEEGSSTGKGKGKGKAKKEKEVDPEVCSYSLIYLPL